MAKQCSGRYGKAAKALAALQSIRPDDAGSHWRLAALQQQLASCDVEQVATSVSSVLAGTSDASNASIEVYNSAYLQRHPEDSEALVSAGKAAWWSAPQQDSEATFSLFRQAARPELNATVALLQDALSFAEKQMVAGRRDLDGLREAFAAALPQATAFQNEDAVEAQRQSIKAARTAEQGAGNEESSAESL